MNATPKKLKRAELTSTIGAGVLGAGLALLFEPALRPHTLPILLLGLVSHSWGMYHKHFLEARSEAPSLWWAE